MPDSVEAALVVGFLVLPGFITVMVYSRFSVGANRTDGQRLLASIVFGAWNLLFALAAGCLTGLTARTLDWANEHHVSSVATGLQALAHATRGTQLIAAGTVVLGCFVLPVVWGLIVCAVVNRRALTRLADVVPWLGDPRPAWDWLLQQGLYGVRIRLKNGTWVMGVLVAASTRDEGEDVCLKSVRWWDEKSSRWLRAKRAPLLHVPKTSILHAEFFEVHPKAPASPPPTPPGPATPPANGPGDEEPAIPD